MAARSALLVVDKPSGITSHQVVSRARRVLGTKKVGHAGTLDPMATGVLVLGVERGTRLLGHLSLTTKEYTATIRLGAATVTDDADGEVTDAPGAHLAEVGPRLASAVARYVGEIQQVPSSVSAIKVNGERAYALARQGRTPELRARTVTVSRYDIHDVRQARTDDGLPVVDLDVEVACSSGTYIRALARDLGRDLGVGGHLRALRRTRVGPFTLAHATWDAIRGLEEGADAEVATYPLGTIAALCFPTVTVDEEDAAAIRHGRSLDLALDADPTALLQGETLLALYRPEAGRAVPVAVLC